MKGQRPDTQKSPRILRTVRPGGPGTMSLVEEFGERLVCVRYRYDETAGRCYTTAEIVVRQSDWIAPARGPAPDEVVWVKVEWGEPEIAKQIKAAGGTWNRDRKLWKLGWEKVGELGLEGRVVGRSRF